MDLHQYLIFISIAFFYIISPGPAVFLAINYGAVHGIKKTAMLLLGNSTGLAVLATISALGLGSLIIKSFILLNIVKVLGAIVLFYLGCKMLISVFNSKKQQDKNINSEATNQQKAPEIIDDSYLSFYKKGLFLSLTNPKAIIFFTAIFPQFMTTGKSVQSNMMTMLFLGVTFTCLSFFCMNTYNILGQKVLAKFLNDTGIRILNIFSGFVFIAMSGMLAVTDFGQKR